ncbi:hypothetical protein BJ912DRAFT_923344 [Pholiota molesta]|nr:hypothetical protein BJ912DRAFT_923344 [Pholiota molesta]
MLVGGPACRFASFVPTVRRARYPSCLPGRRPRAGRGCASHRGCCGPRLPSSSLAVVIAGRRHCRPSSSSSAVLVLVGHRRPRRPSSSSGAGVIAGIQALCRVVGGRRRGDVLGVAACDGRGHAGRPPGVAVVCVDVAGVRGMWVSGVGIVGVHRRGARRPGWASLSLGIVAASCGCRYPTSKRKCIQDGNSVLDTIVRVVPKRKPSKIFQKKNDKFIWPDLAHFGTFCSLAHQICHQGPNT